jgi:ATP/maltotriose-dependent transcriptional regulator MalT
VPRMEGDEGLTVYLETAARALEVFSELGDERGLLQVWRRISRAELVRCSYTAAEAAGDEALRYALRIGEPNELARAVAGAADSLATALLWGPTPVAEAARRCEELLLAGPGNEPLRANVLSALAGLRALEADFEEARRLRSEAEAIYRDLGLTLLLAGHTEIAAQIERYANDPPAAEAHLRAGLELLARTEDAQSALHNGWLAAALIAQGRYGEAREPAEAARDTAPAVDVLAGVVWRGALARIEAAAGNLDLALALARDGADMAALTDGLAMRAEALLDLAAVLTAAGDTGAAAKAERDAARLYAEKGRVTPRPQTG